MYPKYTSTHATERSPLSDLLKHFYQDGHQACIDDLLDLSVFSSGDVGHGPGCLLLDVAFIVAKQGREGIEGTSVEYTLRLLVCPCHDVTK